MILNSYPHLVRVNLFVIVPINAARASHLHAIDGCRPFKSSGKRRDASDMISRQRVTAYTLSVSAQNAARSSSPTKVCARITLSRMSLSHLATCSGLKGIDCIGCHGRTDGGLQGLLLHDIHGPIEQPS